MNKEKLIKVLKIIGIVLIVFLTMFLVHWIKNFLIITSMQSKVSKKISSPNYHVHTVTKEEKSEMTIDYYKKNNREATIIQNKTDDNTTTMKLYNNGQRTDMFIDNKNEKIAKIDVNALIPGVIINVLQTDSKWQTFLYSAATFIWPTKHNGKACYKISNFITPYVLQEDKGTTYYIIEKGTGLLLKTNFNSISSEREYEFDNVDDYVFAEPDIGLYTIKNND